MSSHGRGCLIALLSAGVLAGGARAEAGYDLTLAALVDENGGNNYNAYFRYSPNEFWTLGASVGHVTESSELTKFSGTTFGVSADLHNDRLGARVGFRDWDDSNSFGSRVISSKLYLRGSSWDAGVLLEQRDLSLRFPFTTPLTGRTRTISYGFNADGVGLAAGWYGEVWSAYAEYIDYSYNRAFETALLAYTSGVAGGRQLLLTLGDTLVTRANGINDNELALGLDRAFARSGLRLDLYRITDKIAGDDTTGASLAYRYSISSRVEVEATVGGSQGGGGVQNQMFGGLSVTFRQ
jgi:hypothetical protein